MAGPRAEPHEVDGLSDENTMEYECEDAEVFELENLPREIIFKILSLLDVGTLLTTVSTLSKTWNGLTRDPHLWESLEYKWNPRTAPLFAKFLRNCGLLKNLSIGNSKTRSRERTLENSAFEDMTFRHLKILKLDDLEVGLDFLLNLHNFCPNLETLSVVGSRIVPPSSPASLAPRPHLRLRELRLERVRTAGTLDARRILLAYLSSRNMRKIDIRSFGSRTRDEVTNLLKCCQENIENIVLHTEIDAEKIWKLITESPKIQIFRISSSDCLIDSELFRNSTLMVLVGRATKNIKKWGEVVRVESYEHEGQRQYCTFVVYHSTSDMADDCWRQFSATFENARKIIVNCTNRMVSNEALLSRVRQGLPRLRSLGLVEDCFDFGYVTDEIKKCRPEIEVYEIKKIY